MTHFALDARLHADTIEICDLPLCKVLLMNDSQYPWLILVPRLANKEEVIELSESEQSQLWQESARVSSALQEVCEPDKLNVAALGNIVRQLHVHHVARFEQDVSWPGPIWGKYPAVAYGNDKAVELVNTLKQAILK